MLYRTLRLKRWVTASNQACAHNRNVPIVLATGLWGEIALAVLGTGSFACQHMDNSEGGQCR